MTVCRYFLQGNCRFGDRCRFEHVDYSDNSNQRYNSGYQDRYGGQQYSDHYDSYNSYRPQQYDDRNVSYGPKRDTYSERYNQPTQYNYSEREDYYQHYQFNDRNEQHPRYYAPVENDRYGSSRYNSQTNSYQNRVDRNKHEWVSENYKRQQEINSQKNLAGTFFSTSTPKSTATFSFKDPDLPTVREGPTDLNMNENNMILAEVIKQDITASELGNQWPFTCYFPLSDKAGFPGFVDLSPEELRYQAYKAKDTNTYEAYIEGVKQALLDTQKRMSEMKEPSVKLMSIIDQMRKGENSFEDAVDSCNYLSKFNKEKMTTINQPLSSRDNVPAFSFKTILDSDAVKKSASSFSFKLPSETDSRQPVSDNGSDIYTDIDKLSLQDKEQFLASTFTLGKIPTVPPPNAMCF